MKSNSRKHAWAHEPWIAHFDPHLRSAEIWVQDKTNVADGAGESSIGIRVKANVSPVSEAHGRKIVFVHVAKNPDVSQVRDRKWIRRAEALHARCICNLLVSNNPESGSMNINNASRLIKIGVAKHTELFGARLYVNLSLSFCVLCNLKIVLGDCTLVIEKPCSL